MNQFHEGKSSCENCQGNTKNWRQCFKVLAYILPDRFWYNDAKVDVADEELEEEWVEHSMSDLFWVVFPNVANEGIG